MIERKHTKHGCLSYPCNDTHIGRCLKQYGEWCFPELEFTKPYATDIVLDVGANIGTHACVYAQTAKHVHAFEACLEVYTLLCMNAPFNCTPYHVAIGDEQKQTHIPTLDFSQVENFGSTKTGEGTNNVLMRTIDSYNFDHVSLIKIDVEGEELAVLKGAKETINRCHPALFVECDRIEKFYLLERYIDLLGYTSTLCKCPIGPGEDRYSLNLLCVR